MIEVIVEDSDVAICMNFLRGEVDDKSNFIIGKKLILLFEGQNTLAA